MIKKYEKLVRDNIPKIIEGTSQNCSYKILSEDEFLEELKRKLVEEAVEFCNEPSMEEIADIIEVLDAIVVANDYSYDDIHKIKRDKAKERGSFFEKYFLEYVEE